jgi:hypothetical protein
MPNCRRALGKGKKISNNPEYYFQKAERQQKMYEIKPLPFESVAKPVNQTIDVSKSLPASIIINLGESIISFD